MQNFFTRAEIMTVNDLAAIPLVRYTCFKGFKMQCKKELAAFIEFEQIQELFEAFDLWKSIECSP